MSSCHCDAEQAQEQKKSAKWCQGAYTGQGKGRVVRARALRTRAVHGFPSVSLRRDDRAAAAGWQVEVVARKTTQGGPRGHITKCINIQVPI